KILIASGLRNESMSKNPAYQYVYTMHKLTKIVQPNNRKVLEDITLAFFPGAKIGVLGYNGAGKSTVLRIMAGEDTNYNGDARLAEKATVGLLSQEPQLDPNKTVLGNIEEGVQHARDLL